MDVSAATIKELREKTGAGMLNCKNALTETKGDFEKAVAFLRQKGLASAEKNYHEVQNKELLQVTFILAQKSEYY